MQNGWTDANVKPDPGWEYGVKDEPSTASVGVKQESDARKRKQRWGPPIAPEGKPAEAANGQPRKRKSRWESAETNTNRALVTTIPREVTISGGMKVASCFP